MKSRAAALAALAPLSGSTSGAHAEPRYLWRATDPVAADTLVERIAPPPGYVRTSAEPRSFAAWLRGLPMKPADTPVRLFDGRERTARVHAAVVDIDVGKRDLQQCADAIMRLRALAIAVIPRRGPAGASATATREAPPPSSASTRD